MIFLVVAVTNYFLIAVFGIFLFLVTDFDSITCKLDILKLIGFMFLWPYFFSIVFYKKIKESFLHLWNLPWGEKCE